jgi:hypothetical protein
LLEHLFASFNFRLAIVLLPLYSTVPAPMPSSDLLSSVYALIVDSSVFSISFIGTGAAGCGQWRFPTLWSR